MSFAQIATLLTAPAHSGGTDSRSQHVLTMSSGMDYGDASSDDGDHLYTPVSDSAQLVQVAYSRGFDDTFEPGDDVPSEFDDCATATAAAAADASHAQSAAQTCFTSSQKSANSLLFADNESRSASPASAMSSPSFASPPLDPDMLCSTTLLDDDINLDNSSLDLYPSSVDSSLAPFSSPQKSPSKFHPSTHSPPMDENDSLPPSSPPRKRASDTQSPLDGARAGQKPKLSRAFNTEFLPSTLGRSYSARFPPGHRLRSDFVRTYALDAELGSGGYGFVMTARHRTEGYEVAVKFIPKDKIPRYGWLTDESGRAVPKEALFLSKVHHPAIVKFYDLFEDDAYFYVVMELHGTPWFKRRKKLPLARRKSQDAQRKQIVDENNPLSAKDNAARPSKLPKLTKGPLARPSFARRASHDLFECIEQSKQKRFSENDAKYIFAQVVDVIDYLDGLGVTHCDIKDENVVIDKDLKIKLIDFGSVVSIDPTQPRPFYKTFYGTAAYASPEIIQNQPYQAPPAEIWAIGVLLSFLITGTSPFPTEDDKRFGRIVIVDKNREKISDECFHLLQRCLDVDPEKRADIVEIKAHPWLADAFERLRAEGL